MKEDVYGPQIQAFIKKAKEPVSPREMIDAVGCSPQRVYAWIKSNRGNLRAMGRTSKGGVTYSWAEGAGTEATIVKRGRRTTGASLVGTAAEVGRGIEAGVQLTVTRLALVDGGVVIELTGPAGERFHAYPA